jgi:adenylosuccinate synthase
MSGKIDIVNGIYYGDEGKGKFVDYLGQSDDNYKAVVRFQGGNNAGHTIIADGTTYKLHLVPSGIISKDKYAVIGNGTVVDPKILLQEINTLNSQGISTDKLCLSDIAHLIFPYHRALDYVQEARRSKDAKIGSTCRGISPCYSDKINRKGIRVQDLFDKQLLTEKLKKNLVDSGLQEMFKEALQELELEDDQQQFLIESLDHIQLADTFYDLGEQLKQYITDTTQLLWEILDQGDNVLCEGAQGTFLDLDFGSYPFVTSSNIVPGAISTGAGLPITSVRDIYGVLKAFGTRIDTVGPFPTWDQGPVPEDIIERGKEFGTTTGRRRRFGWLDLVAARYAVKLMSINNLVITKIDIFSGVEEIKVCTGYKLPDNSVTEKYPSSVKVLSEVEPVYQTLPGWQEDISGVREFNQLPENAKKYLQVISEYTDCKIAYVGVGQDRKQLIKL